MDMHHDDRAHDDDHRQATPLEVAPVRVARRSSLRPVASPSGAGWYHEAAIETARQNAIEDRCHPYGANRT